MTRSEAIGIPRANGANGDESLSESPPPQMHSFVDFSDFPAKMLGHQESHSRSGSCAVDGEGAAADSDTLCMPIQLLEGERLDVERRNSLVGPLPCGGAAPAHGVGRMMMTNYRVCIMSADGSRVGVVPLLDLEAVDARDNQLVITCKSGRVFRLAAGSHELEWYKKLSQLLYTRTDPFAWRFASEQHTETTERIGDGDSLVVADRLVPSWLRADGGDAELHARVEYERLEFDKQHFRVASINQGFTVCSSYPESVIVPTAMTDDQIKKASEHRGMGRFPAVVWRCKEQNTMLLRSAQPKPGFVWWRNADDELYMQCVQKAQGLEGRTGDSRMTIMDARSYAAAWANRAKGGGFESTDHYLSTDILFMGLPNIHTVRNSFQQLRTLLTSPADNETYLQSLQATNWLLYLSNLLAASERCVDILTGAHRDNGVGESVLVHCSDGWDRTAQIVSFAKLLADPYYRTIEGFETLIRREWIAFGHKFADRNGMPSSGVDEKSPVFLQWLDGVHQLLKTEPTAFEFNMNYLVKLAQHTYSGLFGTFLFNSLSEARQHSEKRAPPASIWQLLHKGNEEVVNQMFNADAAPGRVHAPAGVKNMQPWQDLYCRGSIDEPTSNPQDERQTLAQVLTTESDLREREREREREKEKERGRERGMVRSQSSHSISDCASIALPLHSPSPLDTPASIEQLSHAMAESSIRRADIVPRVRSVTGERQLAALREQVDVDGLVRYEDKQQDQIRKTLRQNKAEVAELRAAQQRARCVSERAEGAGGSGRVGRLSCGEELAESDLDCSSLERAPSDASFVEAHEVPRPAVGWQQHSTPNGAPLSNQCACCATPFSTFIRQHHCRICMRFVCRACSRNKFHSFDEGVSRMQQACDECYQRMDGRREEREGGADGGAHPHASQPVPMPGGQMSPVGSAPSAISFHGSSPGSQAVQG